MHLAQQGSPLHAYTLLRVANCCVEDISSYHIPRQDLLLACCLATNTPSPTLFHVQILVAKQHPKGLNIVCSRQSTVIPTLLDLLGLRLHVFPIAEYKQLNSSNRLLLLGSFVPSAMSCPSMRSSPPPLLTDPV